MKLEAWRGANVLVTDGAGRPVLILDRLPDNVESIARSVADWIRFVAEEYHEFRGCDIHPQVRARVGELAPDYVERATVISSS